MDNFEKYLKENKYEFDVEFTNKHQLWEKLEQKITVKKVIPIWQNRWIQFAAAACLAGVLVLKITTPNPTKNMTTICSIDGVSKEFCMQVNEYEMDIQSKLVSMDSTKLEIPKEVEQEVNADNPMKVILLNELKKNPNNPKIKDAILKYYKAKLELIERIEEVLKKQDKQIKNETTTNNIS
ncbi:MAG TPA: hypothetical protein PK431_04170 [Chitinophagales bacterium]|nr:hypothetical protein [Chitinophagales bacterium]